MSETKFTPGKWYVENGVPGKPRIFSSEKNLLTPIVCECIGARSRRKHDAALIAAAPNGYEYAETTAEVLRLLLETYKLPERARKCLQERIDEAEKLTKKARGEK